MQFEYHIFIHILALFKQYSEVIPSGETCKALSEAAKSNQIYIVGGSIPEICDDKVYNTCTVWDPSGNMIAKHRKVLLIFKTLYPFKKYESDLNTAKL